MDRWPYVPPRRDGYGFTADYGVEATSMSAGNTMIRRRWSGVARYYNLVFDMNQNQLEQSSNWLHNRYGKFFEIELSSNYVPNFSNPEQRGKNLQWTPIKVTSGLAVEYLSVNHYALSFSAEQLNSAF